MTILSKQNFVGVGEALSQSHVDSKWVIFVVFYVLLLVYFFVDFRLSMFLCVFTNFANGSVAAEFVRFVIFKCYFLELLLLFIKGVYSRVLIDFAVLGEDASHFVLFYLVDV